MDSRASIDHAGNEPTDTPISVAHLMRTLRGYLPVILLTLVSVSILYALVMVAYMISKPSQTSTTIRFRLNFSGSDKGFYPNGAKFNASSIISTPVLLKVYRSNDLGRFTTFSVFTQSVVVLEANPALERLNADYQARMAEPKLSPVDRDRLVREFESKRDSLEKNEYAITYTRHEGSMPETLVRKVLSDLLVTWANDAENEQRLLDYPMAVLSADTLNVTPAEKVDPLVSLVILRSKISRILLNVADLQMVPGATVIRTPSQHMSLLEIRLRLEDILRFRVEPLLLSIRAGGGIRNPGTIVQFIQSQLTYDELRLQDLKRRSEAVRDSVSVFTMNMPGSAETKGPGTQAEGTGTRETKSNTESITPIINDTFIDRLVAMSNQADENRFRQKAAEDYQRSLVEIIPSEQAVTYDKQLLDLVQHAPSAGGAVTQIPQGIADIDVIRAESRTLVTQVNEIYQILSRTMNPASQVYSVTQAATTTIQRTGDLRRSLLGLVLLLLLTFPVTVVVCLLHNRVREEETEEDELVEATTTA